MSDRELLELAAKAAGYEINFDEPVNDWYPFGYDDGGGVERWWNAIKDGGDALRLAADLRLKVLPGKHKGDGCTVETQRDGIAGCTAFYDDKAQQMRQAIVRAAAEIGRAMP